jgi:hypothetical protein
MVRNVFNPMELRQGEPRPEDGPVPTTIRTLLAVPVATLFLQGQPALPLQTDLIPEGTWIYSFRVQGRELGDMTGVVTRGQGMLVTSSRTRLGGYVQEGSLTVRSHDLMPVSSSSRIAAGPGEIFEAELRYRSLADSLEVRRTIASQTLNEGPPLPRESHWCVPAGTFDVQTVDLLIAALPLDEGNAWEIPVVDPTVQETARLRISVERASQVRTPSGEYAVWRVSVRGGAMETHYDIDMATRELIAQYIPDQEVEIVLKRRLPHD